MDAKEVDAVIHRIFAGVSGYTTSLTARTTCGGAELAMSIRTSGMARRCSARGPIRLGAALESSKRIVLMHSMRTENAEDAP